MGGELGHPIAFGRTAEIYPWDQEHVLKLFYEWFGPENIESEARIARAIHESGLPIPAVGEIIRVKDRTGLLYKRVQGRSMFTLGQRRPWTVPRYFRRAAELHVEVHTRSISADLPSQRGMLEESVQRARPLSAATRLRVMEALRTLPDGRQLCHGDFWPGNILVTASGEVIIDWFRASRGNPLADLARTTNGVLGFLKTRQIRRAFLSYGESKAGQVKNSLFRIVVRASYPVYLKRYFQLCPGGEAEYRRWLPVVAAARLSDNIPELEEMLIEQAQSNR